MTHAATILAIVAAMTKQRQALGLLGERIAAKWLRRDGWAVVAHRFRSGHRDIDLVVQRGDEVAFVEVKARRGDGFGSPVEAVHIRKQRELGRSARVWVDRHGSPALRYRFDVVGVLVIGQKIRIRHIPDAFPLK
ncbi:MAG: YraN family protein [Gemmatimonadaceae bacterium]|nr:YraN family protein [Gemmatimonadaceae bacterium]